ncbi:MAG TPA: PilZ domain-containing protein [Nevskiaceae bacterium]|nr:PilZ domain-containing protein [Nevskiaceae bacterium]
MAIARLLARLFAERAVVQLAHGGTSLVVQRDAAARVLWLDRPLRVVAPAPGAWLGLSFRVDGVVARCACVFEGEEIVGGAPAWRLRYPRRIDYPQQRAAYRAIVVPRGSIRLRCHIGSRVCDGILLDLSTTGFAAVLPADSAPASGSVDVELRLEPVLLVPARILHRVPLPTDAHKCRIGGCFVGLSGAQQACIDRAVAWLQGRWLRARVRS